MADFTTQKTWKVGDTVSAADMNTYLRDDTQYLYDNATLLIDEYDVTTTDIGKITFDNISADFSSLELRIWAQGGSTNSSWLNIRANNASSSDSYEAIRYYCAVTSWCYNLYSLHTQFLYGIELPNQDYANRAGNTTCRIYGYADANHYTALEGVLTWTCSRIAQQYGGSYLSTDVVTRLDIAVGGNYAVGSKVSLYGYK